MTRRLIDDLPIPIENRAELKRTCRIVTELRKDPQLLLEWVPEEDWPVIERQRFELALAVELVLSIGSGDGDLESRVRACQQLYIRNLSAPAEAVRAGELLFRSRITTGATDVETFWLAVAFAYALYPLASADLRETAWRYLCHAPFAVDPHTALRFARVSRQMHRARFPRWPLELTESLVGRAEHADLGASLLEAIVCAELDARNMEEVGDALNGPVKRPSPLLLEALQLLGRYYIRAETDQVYAREVVRAASYTAIDPEPFNHYLNEQLFDLPHDELYAVVKHHLDNPDVLDALYRAYVDGGRLHVARRLIEAELVRRLDPWYVGGIQPHVKRAIMRLIGGADVSLPRVRELGVRLAILHSRTRFFTEEAQHLARRVVIMPEVGVPGSPLSELRDELELYLRESDPRFLLEREREVIADRWDELNDAERQVMGDVQAWMEKKFRPRVEMVRTMAEVDAAPLAEAAAAVGVDRSLQLAVERALWLLYRAAYRREATQRLQAEIEHVLGVSYADIASADVVRVSTLARSYAHLDRAMAAAGGVVAGLLGGPWGMTFDAISVLAISARSAARIGACFGIEPGSRAGFEFLLSAMMMSVSTEAGEGLVAYLMDQRPRVFRALTISGVHYTTAATRDALYSHDRSGLGGAIADRITRASHLVGLGLSERQWARMVPLVGAVLASGADYLFLKELTEAALHLAARQWVLSLHGLVTAGTRVVSGLGPESEAGDEDNGLEEESP